MCECCVHLSLHVQAECEFVSECWSVSVYICRSTAFGNPLKYIHKHKHTHSQTNSHIDTPIDFPGDSLSSLLPSYLLCLQPTRALPTVCVCVCVCVCV